MTIAAIDYQLLANAGSPPVSFKPGDAIFATGDKGDKMYVVRSGSVEIERDGKVVETVMAGGIFGEMALIDGAPRAATARAKTDCEVAPIAEKNFLFLVHETPYFAIAVAHAGRKAAAFLAISPSVSGRSTSRLPLPQAPAMIGESNPEP